MFVKNRHLQIFLIALVCVHFVCPLFCATYGQQMCSDMQTKRAETDTSCCIKVYTDTANDSETPYESGTACCLDGLERILPIVTNNIESVRESTVQHPISKAQLPSYSAGGTRTIA